MRFAVTERGTFERCKRQAVLTSKNGDHLTAFFGPLSMSAGTVVHAAHRLWRDAWCVQGNQAKTLHEWCLDASVLETDKVRERYKKQVGTYPKDSQLENLHEAIDFALSVCENYQTRYGSPLPEGYKLLASEQKIEMAVPGTEHVCWKCGSTGNYEVVAADLGGGYLELDDKTCTECVVVRPGVSLHIFEGRLDALLQHIATGRIDPLEQKTYGSRPNEYSLKTNDQFLGYDTLVRSLGFNLDLGSCTAYDGMWRRKEIPRGKTFNDLFLRIILPERVKHERDEFNAFLPHQLNEMYDLYRAYALDRKTPKARAHRRWMGCGDCKMDPLCHAMSRGEGTQVLLTEKYTQRYDDVEETD